MIKNNNNFTKPYEHTNIEWYLKFAKSPEGVLFFLKDQCIADM